MAKPKKRVTMNALKGAPSDIRFTLENDVPLGDLHPDPRNARVHDERNMAAIKASIAMHGQVEPIVAQRGTGRIIGGHARYAAMESMGWAACAVAWVDADEAQATDLGLRLNKSAELGRWDYDVLGELSGDVDLRAAGFDDEELTRLLTPSEEPWAVGGNDAAHEVGAEHIPSRLNDAQKEAAERADAAEVPEPPKQPTTQVGDIWALGEHRLICGDGTAASTLHALMGTERADLLLTDPPYGVSYASKNEFLNAYDKGNCIQTAIENDHRSPEEMRSFWTSALRSAHKVCGDMCSYYLFSPQGGDLMMMMMQAACEADWQLKHMLIWVKNNHVLGRCDYNYKHEPVLYGWKVGKTHKFYGPGSSVSTLMFDRPHRSDLHPTMKPVALCANLVSNSTPDTGLVLDIFAGSGSTLMACESLGRRCRAVELSPAYCDVIVRRFEDATGKKAQRVKQAI